MYRHKGRLERVPIIAQRVGAVLIGFDISQRRRLWRHLVDARGGIGAIQRSKIPGNLTQHLFRGLVAHQLPCCRERPLIGFVCRSFRHRGNGRDRDVFRRHCALKHQVLAAGVTQEDDFIGIRTFELGVLEGDGVSARVGALRMVGHLGRIVSQGDVKARRHKSQDV